MVLVTVGMVRGWWGVVGAMAWGFCGGLGLGVEMGDQARIRWFMGCLLGSVKNVMNLSSYGGARDTK
ncbi:hypothetical protein GCM10007079_18990 [Nocardiopsis terrae]|nr:hypothetical protein GCM10007079_18990 [Nocardiopsis terrae]